MTPSLLPRGALFQGLVSGASGAAGYGLGLLLVWLVRYMRSVEGRIFVAGGPTVAQFTAFNGDTAIVSMQYSFLPSWLSFLVDKENARQTGQALFEAVDKQVRAMPGVPAPQAGGIRREPRVSRRRGAVHELEQRAGSDRRRTVLRADVPKRHLEGPDRQPRSRFPAMAADLRRRPPRTVRHPPG